MFVVHVYGTNTTVNLSKILVIYFFVHLSHILRNLLFNLTTSPRILRRKIFILSLNIETGLDKQLPKNGSIFISYIDSVQQ